MKDYYEILGVKKDTPKEEIKRAFHKLAHKYHPDKKGGNEAKFKEINEAYQVLADDTKRAQYDRFSAQGGPASGWGANGFQGGFGSDGSGGWDFSGFSGGNGQGVEFDLGDIFGEFFGGGERAKQSRMKRGRDISVDIQISFYESIFGAERNVLISKIGVCDTCKGGGAEPGTSNQKCPTCNGRGQLNETKKSIFGTFTSARECDTCYGRGEIAEKACHTCNGAGVLKKNEAIKIVIPSGIQNGEMIRLAGKGEAVPHGVSGDLYVKIYLEKDSTFHRDGHNLTMNLEVKLTAALLGAEYKITSLDGELTIKIPAGISSGDILRVHHKGVPIKGGKRGDLLIKIIVKIPNKLSKKAESLVADLRQEGL